MTGEVQKKRILLGVVQLHLLHVVVEHGGGPSAKKGESLLMTVDQHRQLHRAGKAHEDHPRKRQDHDEGVDRDEHTLALGKPAAVLPVRLGLLTRRGFIPHRELGRRLARGR